MERDSYRESCRITSYNVCYTKLLRPSEAEKLITSKIEESLTSVAGVAEINSESIEGTSIVRVSFAWGHNMDMALIEAKEKVDLIRGQLPEDTGKSMVIKYNPSDEPVMIFSVEVKRNNFV